MVRVDEFYFLPFMLDLQILQKICFSALSPACPPTCPVSCTGETTDNLGLATDDKTPKPEDVTFAEEVTKDVVTKNTGATTTHQLETSHFEQDFTSPKQDITTTPMQDPVTSGPIETVTGETTTASLEVEASKPELMSTTRAPTHAHTSPKHRATTAKREVSGQRTESTVVPGQSQETTDPGLVSPAPTGIGSQPFKVAECVLDKE